MSDPVDTQRLRELLEAATPGPWITDPEDRDSVIGAVEWGTDGRVIDGIDVIYRMGVTEDAALIVAAVNALPALLEEVETLRADRAWQEERAVGNAAAWDEERQSWSKRSERLTQERDALRSELARSDRELVDLGAKWAIKNDALRAEVERLKKKPCCHELARRFLEGEPPEDANGR